jgi:hypothetical protein
MPKQRLGYPYSTLVIKGPGGRSGGWKHVGNFENKLNRPSSFALAALGSGQLSL